MYISDTFYEFPSNIIYDGKVLSDRKYYINNLMKVNREREREKGRER